MAYHELAVRLPAKYHDAVSNFLITRGVNGLITKDGSHWLIGYAFDRQSLAEKKGALLAYLRSLQKLNHPFPFRITTREIPRWDWSQRWKESFAPKELSCGIVIKPPWVRRAFPGKLVITINPKMAFGTGEHATTQLCLSAVYALTRPGMRVLDVGTGTCILAIAAVKLGAKTAVGCDTDPLAIANAWENCRLNKVEKRIRLAQGSLEQIRARKTYDLVLANLITNQVVEFLPDLVRRARPWGYLVLSGVLARQQRRVLDSIAKQSLDLTAIGEQQEWLCCIAQKTSLRGE